ncbi:hypothetical protein ACUXVY_22000 [Chromobacterium haemolyticum]|uniref:hypothetical protein n=1 Tax=Chromobacterium haemolyticum TaxID=394935 RepID=UPI004057251E
MSQLREDLIGDGRSNIQCDDYLEVPDNSSHAARMVGGDLVLCFLDVNELLLCKPNDKIRLWSKSHLDFVNAYRPGTLGGDGLVFSMLKSENINIAEIVDSGDWVWAEINVISDTSREITIHRSNGDK